LNDANKLVSDYSTPALCFFRTLPWHCEYYLPR